MLKTALVATGLLLLTACGVTEVDVPKVEDEIQKGVKEQNGVDTTVDCPDQVDWNVGGTFECDVKTADGQNATATVTMKDDKGNIVWEVNSR